MIYQRYIRAAWCRYFVEAELRREKKLREDYDTIDSNRDAPQWAGGTSAEQMTTMTQERINIAVSYYLVAV